MKGFAPIHRLWWTMTVPLGNFLVERVSGKKYTLSLALFASVMFVATVPLFLIEIMMRADIVVSDWLGLLNRREAFVFLLHIDTKAYREIVG